MKAILVIDVNDDINFEEARANITMQQDNWGLTLGNARKKWYDNVELKPMPKKKDKYSFNKQDTDYQRDCLFRDGYNACIDEILGEQEWN